MKTVDAQTRISLKNILYATDFSPVAEAAAPFAVELARRYGSKVLAVHVRAPQVYGLAPPESWPALKDAADKLANDQSRHLTSLFRGVEHAVILGEGDIWGVVSALIKENHIDLLVIATHGRKGIEKVLLGSVAEKILRRAPCPVLTVNPHVHLEPERATQMKNILFATDFSPASQIALPYAFSLAQENQAALDLLHVLEPQKSGELVHPHDLVEATSHRLRHLIPDEADLWCEPNILVEQGDPAAQILDAAKRRQADMIVLGVKAVQGDLGAATHLPWTTAHRVICEARCPVLTVRG
jgi:nucleotide-binding universal stress UspA family protein